MLHTLYHALAWLWGGDGQGGAEGDGYLITSGPLAASAVIGAVAAAYWRHRCDEPRCLRLGRFAEPYGREVCKLHRAEPPQRIMDAVAEVRDSAKRDQR